MLVAAGTGPGGGGHFLRLPGSARRRLGYLAAKDAGREKEMKFMGIDGLPDEGVTWVYKGQLTVTFLYPRPAPRASAKRSSSSTARRSTRRSFCPP
jgi:hypothetical protein